MASDTVFRASDAEGWDPSQLHQTLNRSQQGLFVIDVIAALNIPDPPFLGWRGGMDRVGAEAGIPCKHRV